MDMNITQNDKLFQDDMDLNPLIRLKEALEGGQKNTQKMLQKLEKFESKLIDLEIKMKPIQATTTKYTNAKDNIGLTLSEVGKTYEYFRVANDVKDIIYQNLTPTNQKDYYESIAKLSKAKYFFESHKDIKSASSVLTNIESLLTLGISNCSAEFQKLLQTSGKSVAIQDNQYTIINPLSSNVTRELKLICEAFEISKYTGHFKIYQDTRISKLASDLKDLELSCSAQWNNIFTDEPYQKGSHPFKDYFILSYWFVRSEYQLWGSTLPTNEDSMNAFIEICNSVLTDIKRVLKPSLSDESSKTKLDSNPVIRQCKLFLVRLDLLDMFSQRYDEYRDVCHPDVRHESSASIELKNIKSLLIEACLKSLEYLLSHEIQSGFLDGKKGSDFSSESIAYDLHPVTSNMIYFCKELVPEYSSIYRKLYDLIISLPNINLNISIPTDADEVCANLLENLFNALESKAEQFDDHVKLKTAKRTLNVNIHSLYEVEDKFAEDCILIARKHLFLSNNLYAIFNHLKDKKDVSDETRLNGISSPQPLGTLGRKQSFRGISKQQKITILADKVESRLQLEQSSFLDSLTIALGLSSHDLNEFQTLYDRDKSIQSRLLKAKFSVFNTGMDALLTQQGEWRVSSPQLRETMTASLLAKILKPYENFYNTYSTIKFSKKHMSEYLKYPPSVLENNLKTFFGRVL